VALRLSISCIFRQGRAPEMDPAGILMTSRVPAGGIAGNIAKASLLLSGGLKSVPR
jgi:hypothetical protein